MPVLKYRKSDGTFSEVGLCSVGDSSEIEARLAALETRTPVLKNRFVDFTFKAPKVEDENVQVVFDNGKQYIYNKPAATFSLASVTNEGWIPTGIAGFQVVEDKTNNFAETILLTEFKLLPTTCTVRIGWLADETRKAIDTGSLTIKCSIAFTRIEYEE